MSKLDWDTRKNGVRKMAKANRSAVTGKFVTEKYAKTHPKTTVSETIKPSAKPPKKNK